MMKLIENLFLSLLIISMSLVYADASVVVEKSSILKNGKVVGFVTVLTPVKLLTTSNNVSSIKINGFRMESYPQAIVRDIKRNELYAEFISEEKSLKFFKVIEKSEDDYGETWEKVEGTFDIKSSSVVDNPKELNLKAENTYEQTCSMCHRLHAPEDFTVNQWPHQIESMMRLIPLEDLTKDLIVKYLQHNAADSK